MTIDERIEALTQSVELLVSIHKDNEKRLAKMEEAANAGLLAFLKVWARQDGENGKA